MIGFMDANSYLAPAAPLKLPIELSYGPGEFVVLMALSHYMEHQKTIPTALELYVYSGLCERTFRRTAQHLVKVGKLRELKPV